MLGPGAYNTNISSFEVKRGTFGRDKKERSKTTDIIGPGAYNSTKSDFEAKKGYTIAGRHQSHVGDEIPGPAKYDYGKYLDKRDWGHGAKIPQADKKNSKPITDLGPGEYDVKDKLNGGFSFGKGNRENHSDAVVPGPGQYSLKDMPPLFNIGKFGKQTRNLAILKSSDSAGPGAYNIKSSTAGGFKFSKDKKEHTYEHEVPGPGNYKPSKVDPLSNLGSFGRQQRRFGVANTAGPAGPTDYNPKVDNWCGGYSVGREKRKQLASNLDNPGVGTYNVKAETDTHGYTFKRSNKDQKPQVTPGFYKPWYTVPDVPKYLLPPEQQRKIHL